MPKYPNGLMMTAGGTGSGKSRTLSLLRVLKKHAAFRDWHARLEENDLMPRGKHFKNLRTINTVKTEEPIDILRD